MNPSTGPTRATVVVFGLGVLLLGLAVVATLYSFGFDGQPHDVLLQLGDYEVGNPTERRIAGLTAFLTGTAGVVCVLRTWRSILRPVPEGYES